MTSHKESVSSEPTPVPLSQQLRQATADQHRHLDAGLCYVVGPELGAQRYANLLAAMFGFYVPFEDSLARWQMTPQLQHLPFIRRGGLLARDLHARGMALDAVHTCTDTPDLATIDHVAGAIYVVEGACLGGQVIARAVRQRLGIGPGDGSAFFTGSGPGTGARWNQVVAWLDYLGCGRVEGGSRSGWRA